MMQVKNLKIEIKRKLNFDCPAEAGRVRIPQSLKKGGAAFQIFLDPARLIIRRSKPRLP